LAKNNRQRISSELVTEESAGPRTRKEDAMSEDLEMRLTELREIMPRLNAATDRASGLVAMVEEILVDELAVEVSARVCIDDDHYLVFAWLDGEYQIHIIEEKVVMDDFYAEPTSQEFSIPWETCRREIRLKAVEMLPALVNKIAEEAKGLVVVAEQAACQLDEVLDDAA
jgi:hypothetical protein